MRKPSCRKCGEREDLTLMAHAVVTWDARSGEWEYNYCTRTVWINCGSCGNTWKPRAGEAIAEVM